MKESVFGIGGCEEVKSSISWAQRHEKREHQVRSCVAEQKVGDWQMNAWTSQIYDIVRDRRGMADDQLLATCSPSATRAARAKQPLATRRVRTAGG